MLVARCWAIRLDLLLGNPLNCGRIRPILTAWSTRAAAAPAGHARAPLLGRSCLRTQPAEGAVRAEVDVGAGDPLGRSAGRHRSGPPGWDAMAQRLLPAFFSPSRLNGGAEGG